MKTAFVIIFAAFFFLLLIPSPAHAQCLGACLQSFTISPSTVYGDQSDFATAVVTVYVGDPNETTFPVYIYQITGPGSVGIYCGAGQPYAYGCYFPVSQESNTLVFAFNGYNSSSTTDNDNITIQWDVNLSAPLNISPVGSPQQPPPSDPNAAGHCQGAGPPLATRVLF